MFSLLVSGPAAALIDEGAPSSFIKKLASAAITMVADKDLDRTARTARFRRLLKDGFALKAISRFVLGRYWKKTSAAQRQRYTALFEDYLIASYASRLGDYGGETFKVTGEKRFNGDSASVTTLILRPRGAPVRVVWQIRERQGGLKIVDVVIEGISMSLTQRSDFAAGIHGKGGNIDAFLDALEEKVRHR